MTATTILLEEAPNGVLQDSAGNALAGHQIYVYQRGTGTQVQVYSDSAATIPLSQPLITSATGAIPGYVLGEQTLDLYDATTGQRVATDVVAAADVASGIAGALQKANNLSDLANIATARTNLGLGSAATQPSSAFDTAGAAAAAQAASLQQSANLSDVADPGSSRANIRVPVLSPAACVATANVSALSGLPTIDGYTVQNSDLILLTAQTTGSQNGLWQAPASGTGAWTRPTEFPAGGVVKAREISVINGTANAKTRWLLNTNTTLTIDTSTQAWTLFTGAGGGSSTLAGDSDVAISSPANNQGLIYNTTSGKWQNASLASAGAELTANKDQLNGYAGLDAAGRLKSVELPASTLIGPIASRIWTFGHSYLAGGGTTHVDRQFITMLAGLVRSDLRDLGVGGSEAANDQSWLPTTSTGGITGWGGWAWLLQNVVPYTTGAPYTPGVNYLPLIVTGLNDLLQHVNDASGAPVTIFKEALRTHISRLCAAAIYEESDASIAYGGATWQPVKADSNKNSGSGYRPIPANGATITITLPNDFEGGSVALGFTAWPAGDGQIAFTGTASHLPATKTLSGLAYAAGGTGAKRNSSNGIVCRASGLSAADAGKTIIATYSGGAGTQFATPAAPSVSVIGTAGATTYTYERVYRTYNGDTIPSTTTSVATGNATLSGTNYNQIAAGPAWPSGVEAELIIRTVGGTQQGIVGYLTNGPAVVNDQNPAVIQTGYAANSANPLVGGAAFDYWQIESNNPPTRVAVCNIATLPSGEFAGSGVTAANFTSYNAAITALAAEFTDVAGQVQVIDIDSALGGLAANFTTYSGGVGGLNSHPNNRGHAIVADTIRSALQAWSATIAGTAQAHQARVARRIVGRAQVVRRYDTGTATDNGSDYTLTSSWNDVDATNLSVQIDAQVGDDIEVVLSGMWSVQNVAAYLDVALFNAAGTLIRYASANAGTPTTPQLFGWPTWATPGDPSAALQPLSGSALLTVQPGDLIVASTVPGLLWLKLRGTGNTKILYGGGSSSSPPLIMQVRNLGARNTPGFNAS